jgi:hypothetical protein
MVAPDGELAAVKTHRIGVGTAQAGRVQSDAPPINTSAGGRRRFRSWMCNDLRASQTQQRVFQGEIPAVNRLVVGLIIVG